MEALLFRELWKRTREGKAGQKSRRGSSGVKFGWREVGVVMGWVVGLKAFGLVPVEPALWHAAFQEINTTVFPFTPPACLSLCTVAIKHVN